MAASMGISDPVVNTVKVPPWIFGAQTRLGFGVALTMRALDQHRSRSGDQLLDAVEPLEGGADGRDLAQGVDLDQERLAIADAVGATHTVQSGDPDHVGQAIAESVDITLANPPVANKRGR